MEFLVHANEYANLFSMIPWIRFFFPETSSYKQCRETSMEMFAFMKDIVDKQIATFQEGHLRHFMDVYIKEMKDAEAKGEKSAFFYDQLVMVCTDFLLPSVAAIQAQVSFLFRVMLHKGDVLKKIQDEIEAVVGSGRLPELDDRVK